MRWLTQLLWVGVANATLNFKKMRPALSEQVLSSEQPPLRRQAAPKFLTSSTQSEQPLYLTKPCHIPRGLLI